jgi:hypothetical protein
MGRWEIWEVVFAFGFGGVVFWFGIFAGGVLGFDLGRRGCGTGFVWVVFGFFGVGLWLRSGSCYGFRFLYRWCWGSSNLDSISVLMMLNEY